MEIFRTHQYFSRTRLHRLTTGPRKRPTQQGERGRPLVRGGGAAVSAPGSSACPGGPRARHGGLWGVGPVVLPAARRTRRCALLEPRSERDAGALGSESAGGLARVAWRHRSSGKRRRRGRTNLPGELLDAHPSHLQDRAGARGGATALPTGLARRRWRQPGQGFGEEAGCAAPWRPAAVEEEGARHPRGSPASWGIRSGQLEAQQQEPAFQAALARRAGGCARGWPPRSRPGWLGLAPHPVARGQH